MSRWVKPITYCCFSTTVSVVAWRNNVSAIRWRTAGLCVSPLLPLAENTFAPLPQGGDLSTSLPLLAVTNSRYMSECLLFFLVAPTIFTQVFTWSAHTASLPHLNGAHEWYDLSVFQHLLCFANPITYMNAPPSSSLNPTRPQCSSLDLFCLACRPRTARCVRRRSSLSLPVRRPPAWESHRKREKYNPHKHTHTHKHTCTGKCGDTSAWRVK